MVTASTDSDWLRGGDSREPFVPGQPTRAAVSLGWKIWAFLFLPICVGIGLLFGAVTELWPVGIALSFVLWLGGLWALCGRQNLSGKRLAQIILLLAAGSVVEGFFWATLVLH
jgi:hypothetical protein